MKRSQKSKSMYSPYGGPPSFLPTPLPLAVSSNTNSKDPTSKDSRLFVGNLNTVILSKEDVEAIFSPYGHVSGISLHKGFAFVQYLHPDAARWAGASEDGKMYAGQVLDINIVSQPKNRSGLKRSSSGNQVQAKKVCQESSATSQSTESGGNSSQSMNKSYLSSINGAYSDAGGNNSSAAQSGADIVICGVCKSQFDTVQELMQHKKVPCRLTLSCQCQHPSDPPMPSRFECASCGNIFETLWALCVHCSEDHMMPIYRK